MMGVPVSLSSIPNGQELAPYRAGARQDAAASQGLFPSLLLMKEPDIQKSDKERWRPPASKAHKIVEAVGPVKSLETRRSVQ